MKLEALGIDPKTGWHRKNPLTVEEQAFLGVLWVDHEGKENAIPAVELAKMWAARLGAHLIEDCHIEEWKRDLRKMQNHLLKEHVHTPVLSAAGRGGGYWIAGSNQEGKDFRKTFWTRSMTGMTKAIAGDRASMVDATVQLAFQFEELVDKTGIQTPRIIPRGGVPAPIEVVDAFIAKMTLNPEKFADGLAKIGEKYGGVLLPKGKFDAMIAAIKTKTAELQELARGLEI